MTAVLLDHPTAAIPAVPRGRDLTSLATESLEELLHQAHDGDLAAFEELYRRTCRRLFGMAVRVLRSTELAAEVVQEVYVEVWQQTGRFEASRGSALAWMTTMTHRRAVDRVRSTASATARDERWAAASWQRETDEVWEQASRRLDAARVRAALSELTALQRQTVVALYLDGRTQTELATELGVPVSTVKTRLRDALTRLRVVLATAAA